MEGQTNSDGDGDDGKLKAFSTMIGVDQSQRIDVDTD
jgi:hypothetical protein